MALWGTDAAVVVTDRSEGDQRLPEREGDGGRDGCAEAGPGEAGDVLARRTGRHVVLARQVHGAEVLVLPAGRSAAELAAAVARRQADGLVTDDASLALAVLGADCGLIALASPEGVVGVAHAGWRGLSAGIVAATVSAMRRAGAGEIVARLGPCIHPCCYAFGGDDLEALRRSCPDAVAGETRAGDPALDLPASLRRALERAGVCLQPSLGGCTACSDRWFSHRRGDAARHALAVFRAPA